MALTIELELGRELRENLCKALGLNPDLTRRIILDVPADGFVMAYVEQYVNHPNDPTFGIDWSALKGMHIEQVP